MTYNYGGKDYACNACGDCTQAATDIARACTATPGVDASVPDSSAPQPDAGSGVQCSDRKTCPDGKAYSFCATLVAGTCTSAALRFDDGASLPCASCTDCEAAEASAVQRCTPPTPDSGTGDASDASTCGTPPALHPEAKPGVYCPFASAGPVTCDARQECCETPQGAAVRSTCEPLGSACPLAGSTLWQCEDALDCAASPSGRVCCGVGAVQLDAACGFRRGSGFTGSHCAQACGAGEVTICETQLQCASGTCTPFKTQGLALGLCL
jgi:hypothetical protein